MSEAKSGDGFLLRWGVWLLAAGGFLYAAICVSVIAALGGMPNLTPLIWFLIAIVFGRVAGVVVTAAANWWRIRKGQGRLGVPRGVIVWAFWSAMTLIPLLAIPWLGCVLLAGLLVPAPAKNILVSGGMFGIILAAVLSLTKGFIFQLAMLVEWEPEDPSETKYGPYWKRTAG